MKDIFLIMNPGSRSGKSQKSFSRILGLVEKSGRAFDYRMTQCLGDAYDFSRFANLSGYKTIVAVGGDGTINGTVNGFYDDKGQRLSDARFGVIYTGTSPDFNKSYRIPVDIDKAVETVINGTAKEIAVGRVHFGDQPSVRYFVCCANIGLGAQLARKANSGIRAKLGDFGGTFVSLLGLLKSFQPFGLDVDLDGRQKHISKLVNLSVGITPYIASGIKVPIDSGQTDKFYTMTVRDLTLSRTLKLLRRVYGGKSYPNSNFLSLDACVSLECSSTVPIEVEADGDPIGQLPCSISFADRLLLLVGKEGR